MLFDATHPTVAACLLPLQRVLLACAAGQQRIEQGLAGRRLLLTCDAVDSPAGPEDLLQHLLPSTLGPGSRIIAVSRSKAALQKVHQTQEGSRVIWKKVSVLPEQQARQLFGAFAQPQAAVESEIGKVVAACGGLPLSLKVTHTLC